MAIKQQTWVKVGSLAGIAAVIVAVVGVLAARSSDDDRSMQSEANAGNVCVVNGDSSQVRCEYEQQAQSVEEKTEEAILAESEKFGDVPPEGDGPWPFIVVRDGGIGLKVRTTGTADGEQIGGLATHHTAWVMCFSETGFDPVPSTGNGSRWYKIKWSNLTPGEGYFESNYSATGTGWIYGGYVVPVGHSGAVPEC